MLYSGWFPAPWKKPLLYEISSSRVRMDASWEAHSFRRFDGIPSSPKALLVSRYSRILQSRLVQYIVSGVLLGGGDYIVIGNKGQKRGVAKNWVYLFGN